MCNINFCSVVQTRGCPMTTEQTIPLISVLDSCTGFLLCLKLYECKVPPDTNVCNLTIWFKMPLNILNFCAEGVKVDNKEGSRWLYIPSRPITVLRHWFNLLKELRIRMTAISKVSFVYLYTNGNDKYLIKIQNRGFTLDHSTESLRLL